MNKFNEDHMIIHTQFIYSSHSVLIPNTKSLDGTGISVQRCTVAAMGDAPFEFVVEYDPSTITQHGREVLKIWEEKAMSFENLHT